ncbi:hypothetical protein HK105_202612 [Polyrhizophydium stewartii]|uniref:Ankyrin repeat protein n=1 Tax=Polyrhizophydium stewartii TaxID=2732419 RepID=A0ABR4NDX1_9FUNG
MLFAAAATVWLAAIATAMPIHPHGNHADIRNDCASIGPCYPSRRQRPDPRREFFDEDPLGVPVWSSRLAATGRTERAPRPEREPPSRPDRNTDIEPPMPVDPIDRPDRIPPLSDDDMDISTRPRPRPSPSPRPRPRPDSDSDPAPRREPSGAGDSGDTTENTQIPLNDDVIKAFNDSKPCTAKVRKFFRQTPALNKCYDQACGKNRPSDNFEQMSVLLTCYNSMKRPKSPPIQSILTRTPAASVARWTPAPARPPPPPGGSHWDRLPAELRLEIARVAGPLTAALCSGRSADAPLAAAECRRLWVDVLSMEWPHDLRLLPAGSLAACTAQDMWAVGSKRMLKRVWALAESLPAPAPAAGSDGPAPDSASDGAGMSGDEGSGDDEGSAAEEVSDEDHSSGFEDVSDDEGGDSSGFEDEDEDEDENEGGNGSGGSGDDYEDWDGKGELPFDVTDRHPVQRGLDQAAMRHAWHHLVVDRRPRAARANALSTDMSADDIIGLPLAGLFKIDWKLLLAAAAFGHIELMQLYHERIFGEGLWTTDLMRFAVIRGHVHVVRWLLANRTELDFSESAVTAALWNNLDAFKLLAPIAHEVGLIRSACIAAKQGSVDMLAWLLRERPASVTTEVLSVSAPSMDDGVLRLLRKARPEWFTPEEIREWVRRDVEGGDVQLLGWIVRTFPDVLAGHAVTTVDGGDAADVLAWLAARHCAPFDAVIKRAVARRQVRVVRWIVEHNVGARWYSAALRRARKFLAAA